MAHKCDVCKTPLIVDETKNLSGTTYTVYACSKCKKKVAKHQ